MQKKDMFSETTQIKSLKSFLGENIIPSGSVVSTNSWEVPDSPLGFYPFESTYQTKIYGLHMANPDDIKFLLANLKYGRGNIILNPGYEVDYNNPFCDLLFFNILKLKIK